MHTLGIDTLVTLVAYIVHGIRRDTTNHFEQDRATTARASAKSVALQYF
jgi:nanoRNase/pAp phosphatase (c-di-AMP/oligoRNAs hydrolase)